MRKILSTISSFILPVVLLTLLSGVSLADTLYLTDGSVLQGTFVGYENGYFLFQISSGDENARPLRFEARRVKRLVIDRNTANVPDNRPGDLNPTPPPRGGFESFPQFEVRLLDQWVRSEVEVMRGQRVRVEASGQIYLDGRTPSSPDGINRRGPDAPMPNENDGALITAIGAEPNSPPILIGRSREFVAQLDGVLYFTANHWNTTDARGAYQVRVSVERRGSNAGGTPSNPDQNRGERSLTVSASRQWTDTGIDVEPGMIIEVTASGTISIGNNRRVGADGDNSQRGSSSLPLQNAPAGALLAKIRYRQGGDSAVVPVGTSNRLNVEQGEYGRLWLGINDDYTGDNSGTFSVRIRYGRQ
ncbi:MAG TPA: LecA/PA-IL family lectin [Blastocatellia bacterium]|nr:LecA/PA-IL family lectin [Blastocatellia bacterium]